jgi:hypothetical protein
MYKEARNLMVDLYRRDVRRRLTFTEARRQLAGDAAALQRIFEFLEHWGLLNYQAPGGGGAADPDIAPDGAPRACAASSSLLEWQVRRGVSTGCSPVGKQGAASTQCHT